MIIAEASNSHEWDTFLIAQRYRPFLQSWTMGEVYRDCGEEPIRIVAREGNEVIGICQAIDVKARRGRHLAVLYGPVLPEKPETRNNQQPETLRGILEALKRYARERSCAFIRVSPFIPQDQWNSLSLHLLPSPLHVLAEHVWYIPLTLQNPWGGTRNREPGTGRTEADILKEMRATTRNLIRRAEREGVTVRASEDPARDLPHFLRLHEETRRRHRFTPYAESFFRAQVSRFAPRNGCTLYLAEYRGIAIAASIHMHVNGETSYHHGASSSEHRNVPASHLLQWTAIRDALKRGDHVYNFWGISPRHEARDTRGEIQSSRLAARSPRHPFAGVTLFKTGFGGKLLPLVHCRDLPLSPRYAVAWGIETVRKWRRGF